MAMTLKSDTDTKVTIFQFEFLPFKNGVLNGSTLNPTVCVLGGGGGGVWLLLEMLLKLSNLPREPEIYKM